MSVRVDASQQSACPSGPVAGKVCVPVDQKFEAIVVADIIPEAGYFHTQAWLEYGETGLDFKESATVWPDCSAADLPGGSPTAASRGCIFGFTPQFSFYEGDLFTFSFTCPRAEGSHTLELIPAGVEPAGPNGALFTDGNAQQRVPAVQGIDINCVIPPTAMSVRVEASQQTACPGLPVAGKVCVIAGQKFDAIVVGDVTPEGGYRSAQAWLEYGTSGLTFMSSETIWPDCRALEFAGGSATGASRSCHDRVLTCCHPFSLYTGDLFTFSFTCPEEKSSHTLDLIPAGVEPAGPNGAEYIDIIVGRRVPATLGLDVDCLDEPTTAMSLRVDESQQTDCPGGPEAGKACVLVGQKFDAIVVADVIPEAGYVLAQAWLEYGASGLTFVNSATIWPDCTSGDLPGGSLTAASRSCVTGLVAGPASFYEGDLFTFSFTCPGAKGSHTINLLPAGVEPANTNGALYTDGNGQHLVPAVQGIDVECVNLPTPTPTNTPITFPRMSENPALSNHWLTRQGAKIPPADCLAGTPTTLAEDLSQAIDSPDTKSPGSFQQLAAFEFEVHYDNKKVCVTLTPGVEFEVAGAVCVIEDSSTKPQLEGVARIGCVTIGKGHSIDELVSLASIDVYPQPELYSQIKPNQNNGVVVQLSNVNCDLGDEQGEAISIFSCDDTDITFRYLEGDVEPDCVIDAIDAQAIAFRWGVEKGSLIYKDFMNLEPSSAQADADIDINDLQFVFGRSGSTCDDPHPAQDPVNPSFSAPTPTPTVTPTPCPGLCPTPTNTPTGGPRPEMVLKVRGGDCNGIARPTTCNLGGGETFTLSVDAPVVPASGYVLFQVLIDYGPSLTYKPETVPTDAITWPDCVHASHVVPTPGTVHLSCVMALTQPSTYTGNLLTISFTCPPAASTTEVRIIPSASQTLGALFRDGDGRTVDPVVSPLTINCGP
jgi:hypothetical protein